MGTKAAHITTNSRHGFNVNTNLLGHDFKVNEHDRVLVSVASVIDFFSYVQTVSEYGIKQGGL